LVEPINVANLQVNQRSQINEYTVEPSLAAQDINPIAYVPDLISHPALEFCVILNNGYKVLSARFYPLIEYVLVCMLYEYVYEYL